jgi:hypothetical protein
MGLRSKLDFKLYDDHYYNIFKGQLKLSDNVFATQVHTVQQWHAPFDDQLLRLYMRKVYLEYRQVFDKSITFRMDPNPGIPNGLLVKHQWGAGGFCWSNHAFRVHADVLQGEYHYQCH